MVNIKASYAYPEKLGCYGYNAVLEIICEEKNH